MKLNGGSVHNHFFFGSKTRVISLERSSYPWGFIVVVRCVHTADVVDGVGIGDVIGLGGCGGERAVAGSLAVQEAQREQAEVGLVAQVDQAQVGVVALGRALLVGRRLFVAVDAAAQQLLVLRGCIVFTVCKGNTDLRFKA